MKGKRKGSHEELNKPKSICLPLILSSPLPLCTSSDGADP